jgi:hypothetical protein
MDNQKLGFSTHTVNLTRSALKQMISVVQGLQKLSENVNYPLLLSKLTDAVLIDPRHYSVLMGYDFHLDETGQAKLIEVNTNAGGLWFACQSCEQNAKTFPAKLAKKLLDTFLNEYKLFCQNNNARPQLIAIIDQQPQAQFLYPEMQIFASLFIQAGIKTVIIDPSEIDEKKPDYIFRGNTLILFTIGIVTFI